MKKTALLFLTVLLSHFAFGQRGYIGLHYGRSIPVGDFASRDIKNPDAGYAKPGQMAEISFGYKFGSVLGLAASVRGQMNQTDDAAIAATAQAEHPETTWSAKSNAWGMTAVMVGPYASFQLSESFSLDLRALGGFSVAGCPTITYNTVYNGHTSWIEQAGTKTPGFAYLAGMQIKYRMIERLCIIAGADYFGATLKFKNVKMTTYEGNTYHANFNQPYGTVNFSVGLGFCFN